jgi:hypothetical protein
MDPHGWCERSLEDVYMTAVTSGSFCIIPESPRAQHGYGSLLSVGVGRGGVLSIMYSSAANGHATPSALLLLC